MRVELMRCEHCMQELRPATRFCTACGRAVTEPVVDTVINDRVESAPALVAAQPIIAPMTLRKNPGFAYLLHLIYPGWGLFYAERLWLGIAHVLINTVALGTVVMLFIKIIPRLIAGNTVWNELWQLSVLLFGLVLFWFYGLGVTRRTVNRVNQLVVRPGTDGEELSQPLRVITWELTLLVIINGIVLAGS